MHVKRFNWKCIASTSNQAHAYTSTFISFKLVVCFISDTAWLWHCSLVFAAKPYGSMKLIWFFPNQIELCSQFSLSVVKRLQKEFHIFKWNAKAHTNCDDTWRYFLLFIVIELPSIESSYIECLLNFSMIMAYSNTLCKSC